MGKNNVQDETLRVESTEASVDATDQEQQAAEAEQSLQPTAQKRARKKVAPPVDETAISPKHSIWPLALAFSLVVVFLGMMLHPVVLVLGIIMVIGSVVGLLLERR